MREYARNSRDSVPAQAGDDFDWSPYLEPGEQMLISGKEGLSVVFLKATAAGLLFFGFCTYSFYTKHVVHPNLAVACPPGGVSDCAEFYSRAPIFFWLGVFMLALGLLGFSARAFGFMPAYWGVTTKRALRVGVSLYRWKMATDLLGASVRTNFLGVVWIGNIPLFPRDDGETQAIKKFARLGGAK